jgi:hypothetical protein
MCKTLRVFVHIVPSCIRRLECCSFGPWFRRNYEFFLHRRSLVPVWGFILIFVSTVITAANAQESFSMGLPGLPSFNGSGIFGTGPVTIRPTVQVGYQEIARNGMLSSGKGQPFSILKEMLGTIEEIPAPWTHGS